MKMLKVIGAESPAGDLGDIMRELLDGLTIVLIPFLPSITAFVLVTFSSLRRLRQPVKLFVIGFAGGAIAALLSAVAMTRGMVSGRAALVIVAISIVLGAVISLRSSSETISEKRRDELVRKSDDQSWHL
jgi:hypothetical protein